MTSISMIDNLCCSANFLSGTLKLNPASERKMCKGNLPQSKRYTRSAQFSHKSSCSEKIMLAIEKGSSHNHIFFYNKNTYKWLWVWLNYMLYLYMRSHSLYSILNIDKDIVLSFWFWEGWSVRKNVMKC